MGQKAHRLEYRLKRSTRIRSLIAILVTFAISSLSATIVFPIFAPLFLSPTDSIFTSELPANLRSILLGVFLAAFPLAQFLLSPLIGEFSDHKGRKIAFLITIALEAFGYALSAFGIMRDHLTLLFLGRFLTGLAAGNMSVCLATIVDLSETEKAKMRYFSYGSAIIGIMFVLGPFIGGKLSDPTLSPLFTQDFPMWVGSLLAVFNFFVMWIFFKETLKKQSHEPFHPMRALNNIALACKAKSVRRLYFLYFFFLFSWNMIYQFIPAIMVKMFGSTSSVIGDVSAAMGLVWIVGTVCLRLLLHTHVKLKWILFSMLSLFCLAAISIPVSPDILTFLGIVTLSVFFAGMMWPVFTGSISSAAEPQMQGKVLGVSQSIQSLSMMLAPLLGGFFLQAHTFIPFAVSALSALIAAILLIKIKM